MGGWVDQHLSPEGSRAIYGRGPEMAPLHGIETSKLTSRTYESKNKKTGEKEKKISSSYTQNEQIRDERGHNVVSTQGQSPSSSTPLTQGGKSSPEDLLHRQATAGTNGNPFVPGDPQHNAATLGLNVAAPKGIRAPKPKP
jgi:hypothetical protein